MSELSGAVVFNIIIFCALLFFTGFVVGSTYKRKKVYRFPSTEWLKVSEHPIPEEIGEFIATDGQLVSAEYKVKYNSHGKPVMGYDNGPVFFLDRWKGSA